MKVQIHAKRFADKPAEREGTFNSKPAEVVIEEGEEVVITAKDGIVQTTINGKPQGAVSLGEWDYTAVAITYER